MHKVIRFYRNLSLQSIITFPFLLQIFVTVSLVGYFSWRNGEQAVNNVTSQLRSEVTTGVKQHLESYLETPQLIVRLKQNSISNEQLDAADFSLIQQDFWSTIRLFDSVRAIYLGNDQGKFIYSKREEGKFYSQEVRESPDRKTYILNLQGQKQELINTDEYDPRIRPWYINTLKTQANNWSKIYTFTGGELGITAAGLLKDSRGNTQGIVGVDLILSGINRFLQSIEISKNGQVFILEPNGYLVGTSTDETPFTYDLVTKKEQRLRAINSQNTLVRATTEHIIEYFGSLNQINNLQQLEFKLEHKNQLVQIVPYQDELGLDWLIVVVMPEADFMAEIENNTRNTIWLCLVAGAIATLLGIYTSHKIAQPIANLSQVTSIIARSAKAKNTSTHFYPVVKAKSISELQILARSFNEMVIQLQAAFRDLENSNQTLENRVEQRTEALMVAKEAADTANRAKSEFLAHMSHELRTPLHAILGFTQVALQDAELKPQQRENLLTVRRSGEHLLTLINDVLSMAKIEAGSLSIDIKPFNLHLLLKNLGRMFQLQSQQKNIKLTFNLPPNLPQYIETDPVKLNQILINLIENGIKFTEKGSVTLSLELTTQSQQTILAFAVIDTGSGILPSQLKSIFIPFSQTDKHGYEGTGLGLSICQQFVRLLGGEITVSSKFGQGSSFKFQIPIIVTGQDNSTIAPAISNLKFTPTAERKLFKSDLANMSTEWIEQLHHAAIAVDSDLTLQLINQIPDQETHLAQGLTRMLKNFEYDEIVELTGEKCSS
ncbi:MAG: ATP-binding protein [Cyanobacteria bacterium J06648_1]